MFKPLDVVEFINPCSYAIPVGAVGIVSCIYDIGGKYNIEVDFDNVKSKLGPWVLGSGWACDASELKKVEK